MPSEKWMSTWRHASHDEGRDYTRITSSADLEVRLMSDEPELRLSERDLVLAHGWVVQASRELNTIDASSADEWVPSLSGVGAEVRRCMRALREICAALVEAAATTAVEIEHARFAARELDIDLAEAVDEQATRAAS